MILILTILHALFLWGAYACTGVSICYGAAGVAKVLAIPISAPWDWNGMIGRFLFWGALSTFCFAVAFSAAGVR